MSLILRRVREAFSKPPIGLSVSESKVRTPFQNRLHKLAEARRLVEAPTVKVVPAFPFSDVLAAYFADPTLNSAISHLKHFSHPLTHNRTR